VGNFVYWVKCKVINLMMKMEKPLNKLIGLYCYEALSGFNGHLVIKCRNSLKILAKNLLEPEWRFETVSATWRLSQKGNILTGYYENEEHNDKHLKDLIGKRVIDIKNNNKTDFNILFQDDFLIETFSHGLEFHPLELSNNLEESILILNSHGKWSKDLDELGLTEKEELQNLHSEESHKRWKLVIPARSNDNHCCNCAYFLTINGRFYFWDYGICSNKKSNFDGKVVGNNSSCTNFDHELK